jgi:hypothetical protein
MKRKVIQTQNSFFLHYKEKFIAFLPITLAFVTILIYVLQANQYAHIIQPVMDEATYLLKGKWFLDGTYQPFQDYGPITNKPPFSFMTLGLSQILLEPGLRSGRIFAIILSVLMLIGLWLTVNRLAGKWWAVFSIALFAISPAWIIYYTRAMTQVVSALLVVWSLFFILGEDKKFWQLCAGLILAALSTMIRQNMLPFFGLVVIFVVWMNGLKKGWRPVLIGILVFVLFNVIYWPKIYTTIWEPQLPKIFNTIIHALTGIPGLQITFGLPLLNKDFSAINEIQVFFDGVRYFFIPSIITIAAIIIIPFKEMFLEKKYRMMAFLTISFAILTGIHFLASIRENNFLYSFPAYFAFYLPVGIILIPLFLKSIRGLKPGFSIVIFAVLFILISAGIGLSLRTDIAPGLMNLHVPSLKPPFHSDYELWDVLSAKFNISTAVQKYLLPIIAGALMGILMLAISLAFWAILKKINKSQEYLTILFIEILVIGLLFSPTIILAGKGSIGICSNDVLVRNEAIGGGLQSVLPNNALVYWEGYIPTPLLYLPNSRFFPVQINLQYNYLIGGDANMLEKNGYWNDELAQRWIDKADFLILSPEVSQKWSIESGSANKGEFTLVDSTESTNPCNNSSILLIYKRNRH